MDIDPSAKLTFNGINARSGTYLFEPMTTAQLAEVAKGNTLEHARDDKDHLAELEFRHRNKDAAHFGVKQGIDASKLEQAGWGVMFPAVAANSDEARRQAAIVEALSPLLELRKSQATRIKEHYYKEYRGALGYRPGESKQKYLARLGTGPGPADPDKVPYYLLIVASPEEIPFHVQYQIDVQYAVGRIWFDTIEEYNNYARSVVAAETGELALAREIAFVGVANPDDMATQMSRHNLVGPLADLAESWTDVGRWTVSRYFDERADKAHVSQLFGGPKTPALLFSGSHGMGFDRGDPLQQRHQGALLLQDWTGPKQWKGPIDESLYLSCDDLRSDAGMLGMIAFNFACYGGGTPKYDEFAKQAFKQRKEIAEQAFVSGLHRKMLGHPRGGALASLGHVERAWGYSFMWGSGKRGAAEPQLAVFESTLASLMKGLPVGMAVEYFNERYAEMASDLSLQLEELEFDPDAGDPYTLANMWTSSNDARGYAVLGDPAVRLSLDTGAGGRARESIELSTIASGSTPTAAATLASVPADASSAPDTAEDLSFGLFGRGKDKVDDVDHSDGDAPPREPGRFEAMMSKLASTLSAAIEDVATLEVRTYVSSNANAAAAADRDTLHRDGDLRAFTRIKIDGDIDTIVPYTDGELDKQLWELHLQLVAQAQQARAQTLQTVLSAFSGLLKP